MWIRALLRLSAREVLVEAITRVEVEEVKIEVGDAGEVDGREMVVGGRVARCRIVCFVGEGEGARG